MTVTDAPGAAETRDRLLRELNRFAQELSPRDGNISSTGDGGGGTDGRLDARVAKLEADMTDIKVALGEIRTSLTHVATKADVEALRGEVREVKGGFDGVNARLESKLSAKEFIGYGFTMCALTLTAFGILLANWQRIATAIGIQP